jgi:hypothetical protein
MKRLLFTLLVVTSFPAIAISASRSGVPSDYFSMSVPRVKLGANESIYGLRIDTAGAVIVLCKVPLMWDLSIDNSEGERSHLKATAIVGAYALGEEGSCYFKDFVTIGRWKDPLFTPFDIKVTLNVTDDVTGKKRKITLSLDRVTLTRSSEPHE